MDPIHAEMCDARADLVSPTSHSHESYLSFWQAGYEGADHINGSGQALSLIEATRHVDQAESDYAALLPFGIRTVRESAGWRTIEKNNTFDFRTVRIRAEAARKHRIQILWTCSHYGIVEGLDYFHPQFVGRFASYCEALARFLKPYTDSNCAPIYTPINEISFLTWAVCETGLISPYKGNRHNDSYSLKKRLVSAAIAGCNAIRSVDPRAQILHIDPIIHIVAPFDKPELAAEAARRTDDQFQAWDMLSGRIEPQLGGAPTHLDYLGINYYHGNQWEYETNRRLHWHLDDPQRRTLSLMLKDIANRYGTPLTIAETSHIGHGRGRWIEHVASEVAIAIQMGIRIDGICLYPAINRPDWENPEQWHNSGLWDLDHFDPKLPRRLNASYASSLVRSQQHIQRVRFTQGVNQQKEEKMDTFTLIVFSHLRWDFVFQRPQHLLTRMAKDWNIIFVEEPVFNETHTCAEILTPAPNVRVLRPHTPLTTLGFHDEQMGVINRLLLEQLSKDEIVEYCVWFYTPMALRLLNGLKPKAIIYDCMDELSAFKNAPAQLLMREATLLRIANVVFTGGPSLFAAKRALHPNVHCFPSSVDAAHFGRARDASIANPLLNDIAHPRFGYFGVIDERLDIELIAKLALSHPQWQICLVGPVVKIDPASLPQYPNIHYFPQQSYEALPSFLAGWDVCLLPFAHNDATRFISPTKTLEYMAAEKPIVSIDIEDVVALYRDAVALASDSEQFIAACAEALNGCSTIQVAAMRALLANTSWDKTAAEMTELVHSSRERGINSEAVAFLASAQVIKLPAPMPKSAPHTTTAPCVILGAGPTGLSAAYHLGSASVLVERNATVGGWCRSIEEGGFQFDYAGHIMFSNDPYVLSMYEMLLGNNLHWQNREAWIYSKNVYTRYPFQGALYGLPPDTLKECIVGAIEARFGNLHAQSTVAANTPYAAEPLSDINENSPKPSDCCADGVVGDVPVKEHSELACTAVSMLSKPQPMNFEEFIYQVWGAGVAKHFAIPYNEKLWTVPLSEMETSWLGGRVPLPDLEEMIDGALRPVAKPMGPNARFGYPLRGGFQALMNGFLPHLQGELRLETEAVDIDPVTKIVVMADGRRLNYEHLISTLPLPRLIAAMGQKAPSDIQAAATALRHVSIRCVNLGIGRENITDKHWVYYPEDTVFHRIFVQGNASPHCNPVGGFGLTCEISYSPLKPLPADGDALIQRCIKDCIRVGIINASDEIWVANQVDMPYAYVVYDHARAQNVERIRQWLLARQIHLAGRYSEWEYYNSDHAFLAGKKAAHTVAVALGSEKARSA